MAIVTVQSWCCVVWGCITEHSCTCPGEPDWHRRLVHSQLCRPWGMQDVILQYGGACVHRARFVSDFLQQQQDTHMEWPARSLDISPVEHLWDVFGNEHEPTILQQLTFNYMLQILQQEWQVIPRDTVRLIRSMRQCCLDCIQTNLGHTCY